MAAPDITTDSKLDRARRILAPLQRTAREAADAGEREAAQARVDELLARYPELSIPVPPPVPPEPERYQDARTYSWRQDDVWSTHVYSSARPAAPTPVVSGGRPGHLEEGAAGSSRQWHARRPRGAGGGF